MIDRDQDIFEDEDLDMNRGSENHGEQFDTNDLDTMPATVCNYQFQVYRYYVVEFLTNPLHIPACCHSKSESAFACS
jgi:hypothetical protein